MKIAFLLTVTTLSVKTSWDEGLEIDFDEILTQRVVSIALS